MPNEIPSKVRKLIHERDNGQCKRCGMRGSEIHHRKRRRDGGHRPSNLVLLCHQCHAYVTAHPEDAVKFGWIVPTWAEPAEVPFWTYSKDWISFSDEYGVDFVYGVTWTERGPQLAISTTADQSPS